jgi:prolyl-tRNA synthetase
MDVNETKLSNAIRARSLTPATPEAIRAAGAEPGYASPIGIAAEAIVVVDDLVASSPNLVSGANEAGFHYRNVNVGRDYLPQMVTDIAAVADGAPCPTCGGPVHLVRGVEVGNIFQLGTRYTEALGATYLDAEGRAHPVVMGSYGIGIGRLLACVAEASHDERGLGLPIAVAPYHLYLVRLGRDEAELIRQADELYEALHAAGIEVLYDDRDVSPGVKFADADLIGIPLRATISARSLQRGGVELKRRDGDEVRIVPVEEVVAAVQEEILRLRAEEAARVRSPAYPGP